MVGNFLVGFVVGILFVLFAFLFLAEFVALARKSECEAIYWPRECEAVPLRPTRLFVPIAENE